ncbi:MAG TPA: hypothetical protein VEB40_00640, partial [Flavipsychrobacter sp.]|nr:hypothetical protein [Flavipsychrobacter sp.]
MKYLLYFLFCCLSLTSWGQVLETWAGTGGAGNTGDGGQATAAEINYPLGGVFDKWGNYYFALGATGNKIRKVTPNGIISTVAGTGNGSYSGDGGLAINAELKNPQGLSVDTSGNIYIADSHNERIRKVDVATGLIQTIAGTGSPGFSGDGGLAASAEISNPLDICTDRKGNIFIAESLNVRIRKIDKNGIISTYAGTGTIGHSGDGGPATAATIGPPWGICSDDTGN